MLRVRVGKLGAEHPDVAVSLNNLAFLLKNQGKHEKAEPLYWRAFTVFEKALGIKHPSTITVGKNLVTLLRAQCKHAEAEALERRMKE